MYHGNINERQARELYTWPAMKGRTASSGPEPPTLQIYVAHLLAAEPWLLPASINQFPLNTSVGMLYLELF